MADSTTPVVFLPVQAAYDRWAPGYDSTDNPMVFAARRALDSLAPTLRGRAVVEFGCGTGGNLRLLRRHGAGPLSGFDLSAGMLGVARAAVPSARLWQQDMLHPVPLPDATADAVLFSLTLEHVADPVTPLAEARRLLRPGGRVLVLEIHPYLSLGGVGAHFRDEEGEVRMPVVAHGIADHLNGFARAGLRVAACREWRPRDFGGDRPARLLKRGEAMPILIAFEAVAC
ncbi:class I SAM-dependent methyltransferase [Teichococcus vastitatis]|uniref:Methyltransferase domain-containing protein n=1 Tax=Teichococcus vastitatis TaxID=2307076 RepID=A0ABS9WB92_9PROT|nr:methyltransferase domain-containing protein [Pseudoroseomonas vastitatis]MCI0756493.1 methyltransferase domain-containing protein [Pseudoroseomonas vastitatis]